MNYLSVDVGGSSIKHAVMDENYRILSQGTLDGRAEDRRAFLDAIQVLYEHAGRPDGGIAMSYCGEVDERTGQIIAGGSYAYNAGTNVKVDLEAVTGTRVSIENDGNCAALAELVGGALEGIRDAVVIVVGTGLGGGIILDGKVWHGTHKRSGSLSLLLESAHEDLGPAHGYTDAPVMGKVCGAAALAQGYALARGEVADPMPRNGKEFFALVDAGDLAAVRVLVGYCRRFAHMIYNLQTVLDVEAFAVGGGISAAPAFGRALATEVERIYQSTYAQRLGLAAPRIVTCQYRNEANLIGALRNHIVNA